MAATSVTKRAVPHVAATGAPQVAPVKRKTHRPFPKLGLSFQRRAKGVYPNASRSEYKCAWMCWPPEHASSPTVLKQRAWSVSSGWLAVQHKGESPSTIQRAPKCCLSHHRRSSRCLPRQTSSQGGGCAVSSTLLTRVSARCCQSTQCCLNRARRQVLCVA